MAPRNLACLCVEDLHGMQASWHLHQRGVKEIALELLSLQCGTHDHQLQVRPVLDDLQRPGCQSGIHCAEVRVKFLLKHASYAKANPSLHCSNFPGDQPVQPTPENLAKRLECECQDS